MIPVRVLAFDQRLRRYYQAFRSERHDQADQWWWRLVDDPAEVVVTKGDVVVPLPDGDIRKAPRTAPHDVSAQSLHEN